jgi:Na+-driven multidrug efflux pump
VLPIAFQQFMLAAVSASDALMLGVISQDALSAVLLAGQITFVFNLFMGGLTMGTSILAAQYYGKGELPGMGRRIFHVLRYHGASWQRCSCRKFHTKNMVGCVI